MKKLIQIFLISVLVFVVVQAAAGGAAMTSGRMDPVAAGRQTSFTTNTSAGGAHAFVCLVNLKVVICPIPNVGWNS